MLREARGATRPSELDPDPAAVAQAQLHLQAEQERLRQSREAAAIRKQYQVGVLIGVAALASLGLWLIFGH